MSNNFEGWKHINCAPHDKRLIVWTGDERYCATWVQHPITGDESWLVSEAPDGTQHLCQPTHWRGLPPAPDDE